MIYWNQYYQLQSIPGAFVYYYSTASATVTSPWAKQTDSTDTYTAQTDSVDTWTKQSDSSDTWS